MTIEMLEIPSWPPKQKERVITFWKKCHHLQEEHGHERTNIIRNVGVEKVNLNEKKEIHDHQGALT